MTTMTQSKTDTHMCSPDELLDKAIEMELGGHPPETRAHWALVMAFMATNIIEDAREAACRLLATLYEMPLTREEVDYIVKVVS